MRFLDQFEIAKQLNMTTGQVRSLVRRDVLPQPILFGPRIERWEQRQFERHVRQMAMAQRRRSKG